MARIDFNVVIMHGKDEEYRKVEGLIRKLKFNPIVIKDNFSGDFLLKKVRKTVWKLAHCAIIVMTPDDQSIDKAYRARQNVIFELGYCLAAFDTLPNKYWYHAVIIIKEDSVEGFSDIHGLETFNYSKKISRSDLNKLSDVLNRTFEKASEYYEEL